MATMFVIGALVILGAIGKLFEERKVEPPKAVAQWTASDVANWLRSIGPAYIGYASTFESNAIHGPALRAINEELLAQLGVNSALHRHRILTDIKSLP
jgi:hypothetical protein